MSEWTLTELERLGALADADRTFQMDEDAFRAFYERTARPVWTYLSRMTGDGRLADDLLQETYYRFLRTRTTFESDDHRRNYLFRIATNLVHDHRRRPRLHGVPVEDAETTHAAVESADETRRLDLTRAMRRMSPRERTLLWLAYAHGCSHEEMAAVLGVKRASLKALLFRARRRLMGLMDGKVRGGRP